MRATLLIILFLNAAFVCAQDIYEVELEVRENSFFINQTALNMIDNGNYESAARILEKVIEDDPSFHAAYVNYYRSGRHLDDRKTRVIQALRDGLGIFKEDDELSYYLGNLLQKENRLAEAISAYSDAIAYSKVNGEEFPLVWAYYFNRGNCFLKSEQHPKAILDYDYALNLSPKNADVLTNRGFCHYKVKNQGKACEDWKSALELGNSQNEKYLRMYCK